MRACRPIFRAAVSLAAAPAAPTFLLARAATVRRTRGARAELRPVQAAQALRGARARAEAARLAQAERQAARARAEAFLLVAWPRAVG